MGRVHRSTMVLGIGFALVVSACTGSSLASTPGDSPQVESYLETVAETEGEFAEGFESILDATTRSYATREVLFGAVAEAGFPGAAEAALTQAQAATPPSDLTQDHDDWVRYRSTVAGIAVDDFGLALEHRNMQELLAVMTKLDQSYGSFLKDASREFCLAATINADLCTAGNDLPGGDYGQQVHEILRLNRLETFGLFTFPGDMSPEERSVRLGEVQPLIESSLKSAGEALARIAPPAEFAADHEAFIRFFDEQYETAVGITKANSEGATARVLELFDESGVVEDRLVQALSSDFVPIAAPFFANDSTN